MPNATPRDTRAGFDIYRSAGGDISLEDLNTRLVLSGYGPIQKRSLSHYRSLTDAGYTRYVSINRFDVARAAVPYENASALGRYEYRQVDLGVSVVFAKGSRLLETHGRALETGEAGAMLHFADSDVVEGLKKLKPQPGNMVTIRYLEAGRSVGGRVVDTDLRSSPAKVEVEYVRLVSIAELGSGQPLPVSDARFVLRGPEDTDQTFDLVNRRLYHFFELIEGIRSLVNEAGSSQLQLVYAEPPILRSLSVASPLVLVVQMSDVLHGLLPVGAAAAVMKAAGAFPAKRREWYEGTGHKIDNDLKRVELQMKELDLMAKRAEATLKHEITSHLTTALPAASLTATEAVGLIDEQVLPPLRALGQIGIESLTDEN
jgi:hypothetical protein